MQNLIIPYVPTLSSTPNSSTEVPGVAALAASGSQVWNGQSGAFIANAIKKPRNKRFSVVLSICKVVFLLIFPDQTFYLK